MNSKFHHERSPISTAISGYMDRKHAELEGEYGRTNGELEDCVSVATAIANIFLNEGKRPSLIYMRGQQTDSLVHQRLYPKRYENSLGFGTHVACVHNDYVYDPMVASTPIALQEYAQEAFGIGLEIVIEAADVSEYVPQPIQEVQIARKLGISFEENR